MKQEIKDRIEKIKRGKVPDGFKKTKVGIVPKDWDIINAKDAFDLIGGNAFKSSDSKEKGIRWLKIANVDTGNIKWETVDYLPSEFEYEYPDYLLHENDIVMALTRPILNGKLKIAYIKKDDAPSLLNQRVGKIKLRKNVNGRYIYHYLSKSSTVNSLETVIAGTDPPNLGKGDLDKLDVVCPNHAEQQEIASILSTWDKAIDLKEKLIEEKKKQKRGLMQMLLTGEVRLPGFDGEWKEVNLGDISDISTGDKDTQDKIDNGHYPFFVRSENIEKIDSYAYDGEAILIPGDGRIGEIFHYIDGKFNFHQRVYKISDFSKSVSGKYIYYYLSYFFKKQAMKYTAKATVDSLRRSMLTDMEIRVPSVSEQKEITKILNASDKEISLLQQELEVLKLQKKGLMQLLLTGIVRVNTEN